jgi:hypothetical protein
MVPCKEGLWSNVAEYQFGPSRVESDLSNVLAANRNDLVQNWTRNTTSMAP